MRWTARVWNFTPPCIQTFLPMVNPQLKSRRIPATITSFSESHPTNRLNWPELCFEDLPLLDRSSHLTPWILVQRFAYSFMKTGSTKSINGWQQAIQPREKLIMKSTVTGYCVKMTYILSLILVHSITFIHNEEREAKSDSVLRRRWSWLWKSSWLYSYLLQLLRSGPTCL